MFVMDNYSDIEPMMKAEYGTVISDAIKTAIANYRGGIVCANMTDQLFLARSKPKSNCQIIGAAQR